MPKQEGKKQPAPFYQRVIATYAETTKEIGKYVPELDSVAIIINWTKELNSADIPLAVMIAANGTPVTGANIGSLLGLISRTTETAAMQLAELRQAVAAIETGLRDRGKIPDGPEETYWGSVYGIEREDRGDGNDKAKVLIDDFRVKAKSANHARAKAIAWYWNDTLDKKYIAHVELQLTHPSKKEADDDEKDKAEEPTTDTA